MHVRGIAIVLAVIAVTAGVIGYRLDTVQWVKPATTSDTSPNRAAYLQNQILNLPHGGALALATFRLSSGSETTLSLIEGQFENDKILPLESWKNQQFQNAMLINSVDENQSASGGISGKIIMGCHLPLSGPKLLSGHATNPYRCTGEYNKDGIDQVINVAIVTWDKTAEEALCKKGTENEGQCLATSIKAGLTELFYTLKRMHRKTRPDVLIIPAIGTGVGNFPKATYYSILRDVMLCINKQSDAFLPSRIYLQEWNDVRNHYGNAAFAIGQMEVDLENKWATNTPAPTGGLFLVIGGACTALTFLLVVRLIRMRRQGSSQNNDSDESSILMFGWLLAAVGVGNALRDGLANLTPFTPFLRDWPCFMLFGAIGVFLAILLKQANDEFNAKQVEALRSPSELPSGT